ncbi:MAG: YkvA family protein [Actinomycetota bacterium]
MLRIGAGLALVVDVWLLLLVAAQRLPPGLARDLARLLPDCATLLRRLWRDPALPLGSRLLLGAAALWVVSPIDLVPEFLPVIGPLDDVVVVALALRLALRRVPPDVVSRAWPGDPGLLTRLVPQLARAT